MKTGLVRTRLIGTLIITFLALARGHIQGSVVVPGTSDPWLAGMPPGATASFNDFAPAQSPILVLGIPIIPGQAITWAATGIVGHPADPAGPDGASAVIYGHAGGSENGISDIVAPIDSLIGVFINDGAPDGSPAPSSLDFSTLSSQDYMTLFPGLKQTFFMGDGRTAGNLVQSVIVPPGATRLFLGTMDGHEWNNNVGQFAVGLGPNVGVPETAWNFGLFVVAVTCLTALAKRIGDVSEPRPTQTSPNPRRGNCLVSREN
jgi:hypothetical protein